MARRAVTATLLLFVAQLAAAPAAAQWILTEEGEEPQKRDLLLPYVFWLDSTKLLAGGFYGTTMPNQPWSSVWVTAFASTNGTFPLYAGAQDIRLLPRLFVDPRDHVGRWDQARAYDVLAPVPDPRPGTNDSDDDLFLDDSAFEWWVELPLHYVLPVGYGRDEPIPTHELRKGLLVSEPSGAAAFNPWTSGVTQVRLELFAREQDFDGGREQSFETLGFELSLDWDNRDFRTNPSRGEQIQLRWSYDPGWFSSSDDWNVWEVELSKYFDLGESGWFRQRVVALDFWTADTPSWNDELLPSGARVVTNRPPHYRGAILGGFWRMRAFPTARFNDQAAIYYTAELRMIPRWNPVPRIRFVIDAEVDWIQLVPFVEVGRVASTWTLPELHSDMKWDVGLDLRAMVEKAVVRLGIAVGEEGFGIRAMVRHPF